MLGAGIPGLIIDRNEFVQIINKYGPAFDKKLVFFGAGVNIPPLSCHCRHPSGQKRDDQYYDVLLLKTFRRHLPSR